MKTKQSNGHVPEAIPLHWDDASDAEQFEHRVIETGSRPPRKDGDKKGDKERKPDRRKRGLFTAIVALRSRITVLNSLQSGAALLAIASCVWHWGFTEALYGSLTLIVSGTCVALFLAALVAIAWLVCRSQRWDILIAMICLLVTVASAAVAVAALTYTAVTIQERGDAGILNSVTCIAVLCFLGFNAVSWFRTLLKPKKPQSKSGPDPSSESAIQEEKPLDKA
jgi:ABC-type glycerol-3-phosphate transport system permease component